MKSHPRSQISVHVHRSPTRCPFCHDAIALDADPWVVCESCLSRHHSDCWQIHKQCASCHETGYLQPEGFEGRIALGRTWRRRIAVNWSPDGVEYTWNPEDEGLLSPYICATLLCFYMGSIWMTLPIGIPTVFRAVVLAGVYIWLVERAVVRRRSLIDASLHLNREGVEVSAPNCRPLVYVDSEASRLPWSEILNFRVLGEPFQDGDQRFTYTVAMRAVSKYGGTRVIKIYDCRDFSVARGFRDQLERMRASLGGA